MTSMGQYKANAIRGAQSRYGEPVIINNPASPYHGRVGIIKSYNIDNDMFKVSFNEVTRDEHNFDEESLESRVVANMGYSGKRKTKSKRKGKSKRKHSRIKSY